MDHRDTNTMNARVSPMNRVAGAGRRAGRRRAGFTLIELLVVVAVLAILISILLPALGKARGQAWRIVGASNQRQLYQGMRSYASDNEEFFPGINSSGLELLSAPPGGVSRAQQLGRAGKPVQTFDWATPGLEDAMPDDRQMRFYTYLSRFADPSMRERVPVYFGGSSGDSGAQDMATYITNNRLPPARGLSYLMPMLFQAYGRARSSDFSMDTGILRVGVGLSGRTIRLGQKAWSVTANQVILPASYRPRMDSIGRPSGKVAIADGFRYWDATGLDWDAYYAPSIYGSFSSGTPVFGGDTSYGASSPAGGRQIPLSYRHAGSLNVLMWDGHGDSLTRAQAFDPKYWYPAGSTFVGGGGTAPESLQILEAGREIN